MVGLVVIEGVDFRRERVDFEAREERMDVAWSFRWALSVATVVVRRWVERGMECVFTLGLNACDLVVER